MSVKTISDLLNMTLKSKSNSAIRVVLGTVKPNIADAIKQLTHLSVDGYKHTVDSYAIKHVLLHHGNAIREEKRGQVAVTLDYFLKIPEVLSAPDYVHDGGTNKVGRHIIILSKRVNGTIIYIEEIRSGKSELAMQTMYIKKARHH